jgi:hypothetical protein
MAVFYGTKQLAMRCLSPQAHRLILTVAPVNNTFYAGVNDLKGTVGPATKNVFTAGGYNQFTPSVKVTTSVPAILKSAQAVYW